MTTTLESLAAKWEAEAASPDSWYVPGFEAARRQCAAELREAMARGGPIAEIAAERRRQISQECWSPSHDDGHVEGELAQAAACYAQHVADAMDPVPRPPPPPTPGFWPWDECWWRPSTPRRDLIKAAALIVAEIERLDRMEPPR